MQKKIVLMLISMLCVMSCNSDFFDKAGRVDKKNAKENAENIFGIVFDKNQDWTSIKSGSVTIIADADIENITKVQILTYSPFGNREANGSEKLNESDIEKGKSVTLTYDVPMHIDRLYAACISSDGEYYIKGFDVGTEYVSFASKANTRSLISEVLDKVRLLSSPVLGGHFNSYAKDRGYNGFDNCMLYNINDELNRMMIVSDYDEDLKKDLRDIIFTYLPNKKSNIEKIKKHKFYNATSYPITTGNEPIIVEPIYKNDGGYHEIEKCALYYYYFKDSDIFGMLEEEQVQFFKNLPKYRAIDMANCVFGNGNNRPMKDDILKKEAAYALIFWGDSHAITEGTIGSYYFPEGYSIGFMLRNEGTKYVGGKYVHQGELYCDGRLNSDVNKWGHLASSKLGENDARMAWLGGNKRNFLCCESGTDRDFNDLVIEVEGGIRSIGDIPDIDASKYVLCFEDELIADYDMNDVVIRMKRLDKTHVEYALIACGAYDELFIKNINGSVINQGVEVHRILTGDDTNAFINTVKGGRTVAPVSEIIVVPTSFTFSDKSKLPYIYNKTMNREVRVSEKGEDPHGIMIPYNFSYPTEKVCIKDAYPMFNNWGANKITSTDWYLYPDEIKVY